MAEEFVGRTGKRTLFNIECTNGKVIKAHSYNSTENEIILMPGTYFRVIGKCSPAEDLHIIHLRETSPPFETITPPFDLSPRSVELPLKIQSVILLHKLKRMIKFYSFLLFFSSTS